MREQVFPEVALDDLLFDLGKILDRDGQSWESTLGQLRRLRESLKRGALVSTPHGRKWLIAVERLFERGVRETVDDRELRDRYEAESLAWLDTLENSIQPRVQTQTDATKPDDTRSTWLDLILTEHRRSPFDRVYRVRQKDEPRSNPDRRVVDPLPYDFESFVEPKRIETDPTQDDPFSCVASFLKIQTKLTLIDGHIFNAVDDKVNRKERERWRKSLQLMGLHAAQGNQLRELEIHTWVRVRDCDPFTLELKIKKTAKTLQKDVADWFGTPPTISVWCYDRDVDHDRFVLGEGSGLNIPRGLDLLGKTSSISPIDAVAVHQRLQAYSPNNRRKRLCHSEPAT